MFVLQKILYSIDVKKVLKSRKTMFGIGKRLFFKMHLRLCKIELSVYDRQFVFIFFIEFIV